MAEDSSEKGKKVVGKANFSPDQLKKFLRAEDKKEDELFSTVSRHHRDYMDAIGLNEVDLDKLEERQSHLGMYPGADEFMEGALLKFEIEGEKFALFSKHTAAHNYGSEHGWEHLLMAVASNKDLNTNTGTGTAWITALPEGLHKKILQTIKDSSSRDDLSGELFSFLGDK